MKTTARRIVRGEKGKVLILALVLLGVGGLLMAPTLGLMSTGLTAGQVYEKKTDELYAADAGIEDALWKLQTDQVELPKCLSSMSGWKYPPDGEPYVLEVNGKTVRVTIKYLEHDDRRVFEVTSIATCPETGSSTTVLSYVTATYEGGWVIVEDQGTYEGTIEDESVYGEGDLHVTESLKEGAVVYVEGDLTVDGNIEEDAQVYVKGDLVLTGVFRPGNIEDTVIICVGGDLTAGHCSEDGVEIYVEGNLTADGIENLSKVCVEGNITVGKIEDDPTVCAGGVLAANRIEDGDIYAAGHKPFPDCPMCCSNDPDPQRECLTGICCECPLEIAAAGVGGSGGEGSWTGWEIATYIINPQS